MDTLVGWVIGIAFLLWALTKVLSSFGKLGDTAKGHDRCTFCGARLKTAVGRFGYADTCSKCGRAQSWAKT